MKFNLTNSMKLVTFNFLSSNNINFFLSFSFQLPVCNARRYGKPLVTKLYNDFDYSLKRRVPLNTFWDTVKMI